MVAGEISGQCDIEKNSGECLKDGQIHQSSIDRQLIQIETSLRGILLGILVETADTKLESTQMIGSYLKTDEGFFREKIKSNSPLLSPE